MRRAVLTRKETDGRGNISVQKIRLTLYGEYQYHKVFRHKAGYLESFTNAEITQLKMRGEFKWY